MKLIYFNVYGRAEAIRMALWKAGIQYEDIRPAFAEWTELKASGKCPFG